MFMQLKVLVLTSKKPTFKLSAYTFEYGSLLPYIHLVSSFVSTHMMNAPRSSHFSLLFTSMYYCNCKWKVGGLCYTYVTSPH